jgi:DNA-binding HxlR family transcriptional regulator
MTRTHEEVRDLPESKWPDSKWTASSAAAGVQAALKVVEGRWKLEIMFRLFGGHVLRFSDLERAIPGVSQKMLAQQLRQLEQAGVVERIVYAQTPPKVEYKLTAWGQSLCPAIDSLLQWLDARPR